MRVDLFAHADESLPLVERHRVERGRQHHLALTIGHCQQALLFNVGRGKTLVEDELIPLIELGHIQHAFLDVFVAEPLAESHPFWTHAAITVTPHIAALSFPHQVVEIFAENYALWRDGFQLNNRIDFAKGY